MLLLDVLAAAAAGALTGAGVGGGSLLLLYLTLARDVPQLEAQGINLLYFLVCRQGGAWAACSGAGACIVGSWLAGEMDPVWLKKAFGAVLLIMGARQLLGGKKQQTAERQGAQR